MRLFSLPPMTPFSLSFSLFFFLSSFHSFLTQAVPFRGLARWFSFLQPGCSLSVTHSRTRANDVACRWLINHLFSRYRQISCVVSVHACTVHRCVFLCRLPSGLCELSTGAPANTIEKRVASPRIVRAFVTHGHVTLGIQSNDDLLTLKA